MLGRLDKMLPEKEWLPQAQKLAVNMRDRVVHGRERTAAMVISNESDRWWSYCQRCKKGGVLKKTHVLLAHPGASANPEEPGLPDDILRVAGSYYEASVGAFLASKNMMFPYLPELWYSAKAARLIIESSGFWHGRDLTGTRNTKWMNYGGQRFEGDPSDVAVVVEDLFSMYKVRYATRGKGYPVCCALGAGASSAAVLALKNCSKVVCAYDADPAGDKGYELMRNRLRAYNVKVVRARPPDGLDPKDMYCGKIRELIDRAFHG